MMDDGGHLDIRYRSTISDIQHLVLVSDIGYLPISMDWITVSTTDSTPMSEFDIIIQSGKP